MSNIHIQLRQKNLYDLMKKLGEAKSAKQLPDIVGKSLVEGIRRTFDQSEDPDSGEKWAPLKSRKGKPLVNSGRFRRSIHYVAFKNGVRVGTNFAFAGVHQYGATIVPKKAKVLVFEVFGMTVFAKKVVIPARPFLPQTDQGLVRLMKGTLADRVQQYMDKISGDKK